MRRELMLLMLLLPVVGLPAVDVDGEQGATKGDLPVLDVFASVLPIKGFVERVGGERVQARVMVLPGQSPATYDPSPKQIAALSEADLYIRVGVPYEDAWMNRIRAANPDMVILDLRDTVTLRQQVAHTHGDQGHAHAHSAGEDLDPHTWTSPENARKMLIAIRDQLSQLDPSGRAAYANAQAAYDAELQALHRWLQKQLASLRGRVFLVYHPAWGYFADLYGLKQLPIERAGKAPGPRRLTALIELAEEVGARAIFIQPEFDQRLAEQLARSIQGRVEVATPLAEDYIDNLKRFATILVDAEQTPDSGPGAAAPKKQRQAQP